VGVTVGGRNVAVMVSVNVLEGLGGRGVWVAYSGVNVEVGVLVNVEG
jgi:hypothetical protein